MIKYSIDKMKLRTEILDVHLKYFSEKVMGLNPSCSYRTNSDYKKFKDNWNFKYLDGTSFTLHANFNAQKKKKYSSEVFLEFNPNKVWDKPELKECLKFMFEQTRKEVFIQRFDLAIDIPENILNINYSTTKRTYRDTQGIKGTDDKTIYLGREGSHGRIKIYNKKRELLKNQKIEIDGELTRIEITFAPDKIPIKNFMAYELEEKYFPKVWLGYEDSEDDILAFALQMGYDRNKLSRRKKERAKKIALEQRQLLSASEATNTFHSFCDKLIRYSINDSLPRKLPFIQEKKLNCIEQIDIFPLHEASPALQKARA